ncbi:MAG: universal stress protein [Betaproteobacteria bacterium RBG_16_56_24]|nr:MAG: universal stress protein [Betaproteobacteria bacterium RBG_16_56_24]
MYQRILVPIDGSATSGRALQEAIKLAAGKAQLRLVYVIEETYPLDAESVAFIDYAALQEALRKTGERALAQAAKKVRKSGVTAETALLEAKGERAAKVIDGDAMKWQADLIVIGTHGRSGLSRLLLGSVAEGVARGASAPVLLVRTE